MWLEEDIMIEYPFYQRHKERLAELIEDYDYHTMPQIVDGKMEIYLQTDAMEQQGIIFQSEDNGVTWEYAGCKE